MYIIRDTHTPLWKAFKARAEREGFPLKALLATLIRRYVEHGLDVTDPASRPRAHPRAGKSATDETLTDPASRE